MHMFLQLKNKKTTQLKMYKGLEYLKVKYGITV